MSHNHLFYFIFTLEWDTQKHSNDTFQYASQSYNNIISTTLGGERGMNRL